MMDGMGQRIHFIHDEELERGKGKICGDAGVGGAYYMVLDERNPQTIHLVHWTHHSYALYQGKKERN
ncbi:hypothetical protein VN97_g8704 [Penicillium thymicola]|uniref:Uncharacterized protein n=1 Tax=Penicillium thymicola TaxID=293382 RepID=A0AAI9TDL9_PENTH|nr:hypothetical protein VN97_g8704 [Penicillium thymicola]